LSLTLWNPPAEVHEAEFHRAGAEIGQTGAFYTRKGAAEQVADLWSKGVQSEIFER